MTHSKDRPDASAVTILNVDDSEASRYAKSRILRGAGFRVIEAATGAAALGLAREVRPQLALIDVKLPDIDGLEVCRSLKHDPATASMMVLLISALAVRQEDKVTGLEEGADGYLVEPVEADELLATVHALLRLYHSEQRLQLALKATRDVVWEWDVVNDSFTWNEAGEDLFGWKDIMAEPMAAAWWMERVHPDDRPRVAEGFHALLDDPALTHRQDEYRFLKADGEYAVILDRGYVIRDEQGCARRMIGAMQDVTERVRHEGALRESEERYRGLVRLMPAAMYVCDREGRITFFNEKAVELWGRAPKIGDEDEKFFGAFKLFMPDGSPLPHARTPMAEAIRNGTAYRNQEVVIERPDRSRRQDMLHELANAVNRAEALHDLYEKALDAILASLDADRASILLFDENGVMRFKAWRGLSDEYRRAVEGHSPWTREQRDPDPIVVECIAGSTIAPELQAEILKEGIQALGFIPLMYGGRLLGKFMVYFNHPYSMNSEDISLAQAIARTLALGIERKTAEEALRMSEERFRLAMAAGKVGVWEWDIVNNAVTWTDSLYRIHGIKPGDIPMTAEGFSALVHPDDRRRVSDAIEAALTMDAPYELEFRSQRPDGEVLWLFTSAVVLRHDGRPARMIGATVDITPSKRAAEQLKSWNVELERRVNERTEALQHSQERLRAMAAELSVAEQRERKRMAGELHDHLAQMLVLGRLKLSQARRVPGVAGVCADLITQTEEVLDESLRYTRTLVADLSPPVLHDFGLPAALKWLGEHMQRYGLSVSVTVPQNERARLPEDQAMLLFQSVRELLMNASEHAQSGKASVSLEQRDGELRIEVRDGGVGFDQAAAVPAVDDSATSLSSKFGLFSIRERMRALGGAFHIESAVGKGTTARLTLPLGGATAAGSLNVMRHASSVEEGSEAGNASRITHHVPFGSCWWTITSWSGRDCAACSTDTPILKSSRKRATARRP